MVKLMNNARFNRGSLLGDYDPATVPERPGEDYVRATELVWTAMRAQALRSNYPDDGPMDGDGGKAGRLLTGMGPYQATRLVWPELSKKEFGRAGQAIRTILRKTGSAVCIEQGRSNGLAKWWIADEWTPPQGTGYPRQERPASFGKTATKKSQESVKVEFVPDDSEIALSLDGNQSAVAGLNGSKSDDAIMLDRASYNAVSMDDVMFMIRTTIETHVKKLQLDKEQLQAENDELRVRLAKIQQALS